VALQESYELGLLGLGGVAIALGVVGMIVCYCRTVHVGLYSEKHQKVDLPTLMSLFPRVCVVIKIVHASLRAAVASKM